MSGHSKWSTIKRAKEAKDAKRSNLFTKLSKSITMAAKGDPSLETNFKLRIAVDKARSLNMPKDNIERAIKRAAGTGEGANIESLLYEAYGPEGVAMIIDILTDNKNRAISNLKHILSKRGGNLGNSGSVLWMFELKGEIILDKAELTEDEELLVIEAGADDIVKEDVIKVIVDKDDLTQAKDKLQTNGFEISDSDIIYLAKEKVSVKDDERLLKLMGDLDDDDDVNNIYTNANI
jgi:YebC/PmpR family DNA-binding regulatory protein